MSPCCPRVMPFLATPSHSAMVYRTTTCHDYPSLTHPTGQLKLYLDKETYERSGLSGRLDERSGNRETRSKWRKEFDHAPHDIANISDSCYIRFTECIHAARQERI